jgi:Protein of unknown function (DUF1254)
VLRVEAYVYLYPPVLMELTRRQMTNLPAGTTLGFGPTGTFPHSREFPPADFRAVVRPNFDTLQSPAWLGLTSEPIVVSVPDTGPRRRWAHPPAAVGAAVGHQTIRTALAGVGLVGRGGGGLAEVDVGHRSPRGGRPGVASRSTRTPGRTTGRLR